MIVVFVNVFWELYLIVLLLFVRLIFLKIFCVYVKKVTLESDVRVALMVIMEIFLILVIIVRDVFVVVI